MHALPEASRWFLARPVDRATIVMDGLTATSRETFKAMRPTSTLQSAFSLPFSLLLAGPCELETKRASHLQPIGGKGCFDVAMIVDFERMLADEWLSATDGRIDKRALSTGRFIFGRRLPVWQERESAVFFDDEIHVHLSLSSGDIRFEDVYHFTVGAPAEDARILTRPTYPDERRER